MTNPTLITLEEWDSIINWTPKTVSKNSTYETQYIRSDWIIFTKDTIDWDSIEDLKADMKKHISEANKYAVMRIRLIKKITN